jgi:gliding motility-associated-like protein
MLNQSLRSNFSRLFAITLICSTSTAQVVKTNKPVKATTVPLSSENTRLASPPVLYSTSCNNLDFTSGTTGWDGRYCSTPNPSNYTTAAASLPVVGLNGSGGTNAFGYVHELVTAGTDPHVPISRVPPGHTSAIRLGDDKPYSNPGGGGKNPFNHQMIRNTFIVSPTNPTITYWYAVVFDQDTKMAHDETDQPYFKIRLFDKNNNEIKCASYDVNATTGTTGGFQTLALDAKIEAVYKDWVPIYIPLINYKNQQMTIQFESSDCSKSGHFGYAYIAVDCNPYQVITSSPYICGSNSITLTAPGGASTYSWTGPGIIPPSNTQIININQPGKYKVTMTVIGNSGVTCTFDLDTTIQGSLNLPTALFSNTTVCVGNATTFTDGSTPAGTITSWSWDFNNDGVEDSNLPNPTYTFPAAGTYPVKLTVKSGPCDATITKNVIVDPGPVLVITDPAAVCPPLKVDITQASVTAGSTLGTGTLSYWMDKAATIPLLTPNAIGIAGTYYIKVSANGCSDIKPVVIKFNSLTTLTITNPPAVCSPATVDITDPAITAGSTGNGVLTYWADANLTIPLPTPTAVSSGIYYIKSTPATGGGCASLAPVTVTVNAVPTVNAGSAKSVCPGSIVDLKGSIGGSATSATWSGGAGTFADKNNPVTTYTPTAAEYASGTIKLTLTTDDPAGPCTPASSDVILNFYKNPTIKFVADKKKGCPVHCVNFSDSSFVVGGTVSQWQWNFGDSASADNTSSIPKPKHCYENTGFYTVSLTVISDQGCVSSLTVPKMIQVFAIPTAEFYPTPNPASMYDPRVTLKNGSSPDVVYWNYHFGDGDSVVPAVKSPVHKYPGIAGSSYIATLKVRNADGCINYIEHKIEIGPEFSFYIPNAFTPIRNDGTNDTFFGKGVGIVKYHIWIFDRWGNMVFNTADIDTGWDGRANNGMDVAQQDVFVWRVQLTDIFNKVHDYIGTVTLVK